MPLVLHWRRQGLTESTRPEYRFVPESRIRSLDFSPGVLSASELLSNSFRLGDAMSLCCFSQEQQQQRQSALLATGDRALLVPGPLASSGFSLASCWRAVPLLDGIPEMLFGGLTRTHWVGNLDTAIAYDELYGCNALVCDSTLTNSKHEPTHTLPRLASPRGSRGAVAG